METRIPPPVYMLIAGSLMWILDWLAPGGHWLASPWNRLGWVMMTGAFFVDITSLRLFMRNGTTVNPLKPENATRLVTSGAYRFTRNPMYLGLLVFLAGWAVNLASLTPLLMLPLFVVAITRFQILPEERALEAHFGEDYLAYKSTVGRWL